MRVYDKFSLVRRTTDYEFQTRELVPVRMLIPDLDPLVEVIYFLWL